jgi:hypothetical protein
MGKDSSLDRETGIEPATRFGFAQGRHSAWKAEWTEFLPRRMRPGKFRPKTSRFEHLTQDVLSI